MADDQLARLLAVAKLTDTDLPAKHAPAEAWSVEDFAHYHRTGEQPLSAEYVAHVRLAAKAAGINPADLGLPSDKQPDDHATLDVDGHFQRIRRHRADD